MKRKSTHRRDRTVAIAWGAMAEVYLGGVLYFWLISPRAADRAAFGPRVSLAIVIAALLGTAVAALIVMVTSHTSRALRWGVVLPIAVIAGGVLAMAYGSMFAPEVSTDVGIGMLLLLGAAGMYVVAWHVSRGRSRPGADERKA